MNRRGFLRAVGAAGLAWMVRGLADGAEASTNPKTAAKHEKLAALITRALRERRLLQFRYHGFSRRVESHALGHVGEGKLALLAWQSAGGSATEPPPGWRTFVVAEIEAPKLLKIKFSPRADYDPKKTNLKEIAAEVTK